MENKTFSEQEINDGKGLAIAMIIIPILFFLPLVMDDKKNNAFLKHYSNQELLMIILGVAAGIVAIIPVLGWIVSIVAYIIYLISWFILLIGACKGEAKKVLILGNIEIIK